MKPKGIQAITKKHIDPTKFALRSMFRKKLRKVAETVWDYNHSGAYDETDKFYWIHGFIMSYYYFRNDESDEDIIIE